MLAKYSCRYLVLIASIVGLMACGFKLAGSESLPAELSSIYLVTSNFNEQQELSLRQRLERAGAVLRTQPGKGALELTVNLKVLPDRRLAASASTGKTVERLARKLEFNLKNDDNSLLAPAKSLVQQKDIQLDDDNLLASGQERERALRELEQALFNRLIFQLKRI